MGIFRFPLCQCFFLLLKPLGERLQLTDASVSFGQLAVELVQCGSMFGVSIAELYFQPMDPSLGRFEFLHRACELIGFHNGGFQLGEATLKIMPFLFVRLECLLSRLAYELELLDFFRLCSGGGIILAHAPANRGFFRFQDRQPLRANGQLFLKRLEAVVSF